MCLWSRRLVYIHDIEDRIDGKLPYKAEDSLILDELILSEDTLPPELDEEDDGETVFVFWYSEKLLTISLT